MISFSPFRTYDSDLWRRHVFPFRDQTFLYIFDTLSVRIRRLLLQMTNEAVCRSRREEVGEEEKVEEYALRPENHGTEEDGGLFNRHERSR